MKKSLLMFLFFWVLFLGGDSFQTQAKKKTKDSYKLVFCDEFNLSDGAQPDTAIWSRCQRYNSQWNRWVSDSKDVIYLKSATYRVSWEFTCKTTKILLLYIFLGHNRNVVNTKFPYPIKRLEVIRGLTRKAWPLTKVCLEQVGISIVV